MAIQREGWYLTILTLKELWGSRAYTSIACGLVGIYGGPNEGAEGKTGDSSGGTETPRNGNGTRDTSQ